MNRVILTGRLTKDPEVTYTTGQEPLAVARYTLAVERRFKRENDTRTADFIRCVAFGKNGEFVEKYLFKGKKIAVEGRIQTGSYQDKDGKTVYTTDIVVEQHEFCESKQAEQGKTGNDTPPQSNVDSDGFMTVPDDIDGVGLPFNF